MISNPDPRKEDYLLQLQIVPANSINDDVGAGGTFRRCAGEGMH